MSPGGSTPRDLAWLTARPIAHRGLHDDARGIVENMPAAAIAAIAGNYGIEADLQISADGEAMVHHDGALGRLADGDGALRDLAAAHLKQIPFRATAERMMTLGDLCDVVAESYLEQGLRAQVVPEPMHERGVGQRCGQAIPAGFGELVGRGRLGDQALVTLHAGRLVAPDAVGDQLDLVREVIVQEPVGEVRLLGDRAQAGAGITKVSQSQQCGVGQFPAAVLKLVDTGSKPRRS